MLFNELIATSDAVSRTSRRQQKTRLLAECMRRLPCEEIPIATNYLSGAIRQGRIGIGVAKIFRTHHEAAALPSLTIVEVDQAFEELAASTGTGSTTRRAALLKELFA
ncbi:hypothetical protein, partial [Geomonas sp.]|uniref:hypothetical protein n=1 Tax=Geomonas sp. TaxID=2651584 RepID=UPI002B48E8D3